MTEICYYKKMEQSNRNCKNNRHLGKLWYSGIMGKDSTEMVIIDEEKPLHSQRKDICEMLKYQELSK